MLLIVVAILNGQTPDPSTLPLLSQSALSYVGGFRVTSVRDSRGVDLNAYGGQGLAHDPATNTLFLNSQGYVSEITIPAPVNHSDVTQLPFAAFKQQPTDPTEGHLKDLYAGDAKAYGLLVSGDRLIGTGYIYFDASNVQRVSHYSRSRNLTTPSFSGWSQVGQADKQGSVAGFMSPVPAAWQALLGGSAITGQCCIPIVWRTSSGPAAFAFDPSKIGQAVVAATPLLHYPMDHATLGPWATDGRVNTTYGSTTEILGVAIIAGTRTALYFGRTGLGPNCYGSGTPDKALVGTTAPDGGPYCYDPTSNAKAPHAYPYRYQVWAYDLNDFAAVKAGTKEPYDVVPYGVWPLEFPITEGTTVLGGVGYDAQRQLIYVAQMRADQGGCCDFRPVIQVLKVNASATTPTDPLPPPPVDPLVQMTAERDAAIVRVVAIKALIQQALDVAPRNTATRVTTPLKEALKK